MEDNKPAVVLLVEDDPGDQKLVRYALRLQQYQSSLQIVGTGEEALEYLQRAKDGDESSPMPDIILLDLNMPGMGGKKFLQNMKSDEQVRGIPVVVVSTSDAQQDIEESYKLQAAGYVQKSPSLEKLRRIIQKLTQYWFATSMLVKRD
ncbi:MAG: response regulator [Phycisphaerae bacterium]|jgi:CheY-like chemotaxis protein